MDEFRNMPSNWSYSVSWTQPYNAYYSSITPSQEEMIRIDAVDRIVDAMTAYPQALQLIEEARHAQ